MKKICLQAGHWNMTSGQTGAPGEQELNYRIMMALKDELIKRGFQLYLVDANPPQNVIDQDFDLFLALHGDANIYGTGGGFIDNPAESVDYSFKESKRIRDAIASVYFKETGIVEHNERSNANTKYYYMWSRLTMKTPCNIIEMGVVQDAHDKVILADTARIVAGLNRGICKAFNVPYDPVVNPSNPPATAPDPQTETIKLLEQAKKDIEKLKKDLEKEQLAHSLDVKILEKYRANFHE
jgi:hypothetical protein